MSKDATPYCSKDDLNIGNLMIEPGGLDRYVREACEEIDAKIGWLYETPLDLDTLKDHERKMLKTIARKIATGRAISTLDVPNDGGVQGTYGLRLLQEGLDELHMIAGGDVPLSAKRADLEGDPNEPDVGGHGAHGARVPEAWNADTESPLSAFHRTVFGMRPQFVNIEDGR